MRVEPYRLSVLVVTYNHELYIKQALQGLILQKIDASIELIIADDCSTDGTLKLIKAFDGLDQRFTFKYLDNSVNCGITKNYQRGFAACSGKYIAVLEGDDYWISPFKLQRQIDFLDSHWECDLCSVNYFVFEADHYRFTPRVPVGIGHRFISARELIFDNVVGNFSTCMYRKSAIDELPVALYDLCSYDWIVNICVAKKSIIGFLEEPLSVYRLHSAGVWTQTKNIEKLRLQHDLIPAYDKLTEKVFHGEFETLASGLREAIRISQVTTAVDFVAVPCSKYLPRVIHLVPQFMLNPLRLILPLRVKRFLVRKLLGSSI